MALCALALLALGGIVYGRWRHFLQRGGLSETIDQHYLKHPTVSEEQRELFMTLLCYEDRYPSFAAILSRIAPHFPLAYFADHPEGREALETLLELSQQKTVGPTGRLQEHAAIATLVRLVIDDAQVQRIYGRELEPLVDSLIEQMQ